MNNEKEKRILQANSLEDIHWGRGCNDGTTPIYYEKVEHDLTTKGLIIYGYLTTDEYGEHKDFDRIAFIVDLDVFSSDVAHSFYDNFESTIGRLLNDGK